MSSTQNECTLGGGGGGEGGVMHQNEQGRTRGEGGKTWESSANILFECPQIGFQK